MLWGGTKFSDVRSINEFIQKNKSNIDKLVDAIGISANYGMQMDYAEALLSEVKNATLSKEIVRNLSPRDLIYGIEPLITKIDQSHTEALMLFVDKVSVHLSQSLDTSDFISNWDRIGDAVLSTQSVYDYMADKRLERFKRSVIKLFDSTKDNDLKIYMLDKLPMGLFDNKNTASFISGIKDESVRKKLTVKLVMHDASLLQTQALTNVLSLDDLRLIEGVQQDSAKGETIRDKIRKSVFGVQSQPEAIFKTLSDGVKAIALEEQFKLQAMDIFALYRLDNNIYKASVVDKFAGMDGMARLTRNASGKTILQVVGETEPNLRMISELASHVDFKDKNQLDAFLEGLNYNLYRATTGSMGLSQTNEVLLYKMLVDIEQKSGTKLTELGSNISHPRLKNWVDVNNRFKDEPKVASALNFVEATVNARLSDTYTKDLVEPLLKALGVEVEVEPTDALKQKVAKAIHDSLAEEQSVDRSFGADLRRAIIDFVNEIFKAAGYSELKISNKEDTQLKKASTSYVERVNKAATEIYGRHT